MNEKEEVKKAVMELKMFGSIADLENPPENEGADYESGDDLQPQVRSLAGVVEVESNVNSPAADIPGT